MVMKTRKRNYKKRTLKKRKLVGGGKFIGEKFIGEKFIGGKFTKGIHCIKSKDSATYSSYIKLVKLTDILKTSMYDFEIKKSPEGNVCDLYFWLQNENVHIHVYSVKGNIVEYSVKYEDGTHLHHQSVSLELESDYDYRKALDTMCQHINPSHSSFNKMNEQTPQRVISSELEPISIQSSYKQSRPPPSGLRADIFGKTPKKLGPTEFKDIVDSLLTEQ